MRRPRLYQLTEEDRKVLRRGEIMTECRELAFKRTKEVLGEDAPIADQVRHTGKVLQELITWCGYEKFDFAHVRAARELKQRIYRYECGVD